jgi:hypothetical protein
MPFAKLDKGFNRSSMMLEEPMVRLVFLHMLAECDFNGAVEMGPKMMAKNFSIPLPDVEKALGRLNSPDDESRSPDHEGRRIVPLGDGLVGWQIVNYVAYRDARDDDDRREYKRRWQAEKRREDRERRQTGTPVDTCGQRRQTGTPVDSVDLSEEDLEREVEKRGKESVAVPPERTTDSALKRAPRKKTARDVEIEWRVERVYERLCRRRRMFLENRNGSAPGRPPALTPELRKAIVASLKDYDGDLLAKEDRGRWERDSLVAASGEGLWLSWWHTGRDPETGGKMYVEPMRAFSRYRKEGAHGCETFPEIYFAARDYHERRAAEKRRGGET